MKYFYVTVSIRSGEYGKSTYMLIQAEDEYEAGRSAIILESHDPQNLEYLDEDKMSALDMYGEFGYSINKVEGVSDSDFEVLSKYMYVLNQADVEELLAEE